MKKNIYKPVQKHVNEHQPKYTEAEIRESLQSPMSNDYIWIVAEDVDDMNLYQRMYESKKVFVLTSKDKKGRKSCENVERIVSHLSNKRVIGIRDRDYTDFIDDYTPSSSVIRTDFRDIEMQMLHSESIQNELSKINCNFQNCFNLIKNFACRFCFYRIFNDIYCLGINFKDDIKMAGYWNSDKKMACVDWEKMLKRKIFERKVVRKKWSTIALMTRDFNTMVKKKCLGNKDAYEICQGHNFVSLLESVEKDFHNLSKCLFKWYAIKDYQSTNMSKQIKALAKKVAVKV